MRYQAVWCLALVLHMPVTVFAQREGAIEVTATVGWPIQNVLQSNICCGVASVFSYQEVERTRYLAGFSLGVSPIDRVRLEFGATYMPVSYTTFVRGCCSTQYSVLPTHGTAWEFPIVASYRWMHGTIRPFSGGGLVVHHATTNGIDQAPAPVLQGGIEWGKGRMSIRPAFRYIHYPQTASSTDQRVGRPSTQMQVLLGVGFRIN